MPMVNMRPAESKRAAASVTIDKKRPKPITPMGAPQIASATGMGVTL